LYINIIFHAEYFKAISKTKLEIKDKFVSKTFWVDPHGRLVAGHGVVQAGSFRVPNAAVQVLGRFR
jgi:hypothetical protein